jgi:hypothetical protein
MAVAVDSGAVEFELARAEGNLTLRLPLVGTNDEMGAIVKRLDDEGRNHSFQHLKEFQTLCGERAGLTLDEADFIWKHLEAEFQKKSESHKTRLASMQTSPNFTPSIQPAGAKVENSDS